MNDDKVGFAQVEIGSTYKIRRCFNRIRNDGIQWVVAKCFCQALCLFLIVFIGSCVGITGAGSGHEYDCQEPGEPFEHLECLWAEANKKVIESPARDWYRYFLSP